MGNTSQKESGVLSFINVLDDRGLWGRGIVPQLNDAALSEAAQRYFSGWQGAMYSGETEFADRCAKLFWVETGLQTAQIVRALAELETQYAPVNKEYGWSPEKSAWQWLLHKIENP